MAQLSVLLQVALAASILLLAAAAPQGYSTLGGPSTSTPWQIRGAEPSTRGPTDNSMVTFTTDTPPLGFVPSLDDAMKRFTGQVQGLPYPNFAGFPLYPFTPYAQGLWWR